MKFITLATATAIVACSAGFAAAQQTITVNIGSSHPEQNIWVYAMKNTFQPEVNRILEAAGRLAGGEIPPGGLSHPSGCSCPSLCPSSWE